MDEEYFLLAVTNRSYFRGPFKSLDEAMWELETFDNVKQFHIYLKSGNDFRSVKTG